MLFALSIITRFSYPVVDLELTLVLLLRCAGRVRAELAISVLLSRVVPPSGGEIGSW
jgi:hypothetical protein